MAELQNELCKNVNYSLEHLDPLESKVSDVEQRLSNFEQGMQGLFDVLISYQGRLDEIDKSTAYLFENIPEKNQ